MNQDGLNVCLTGEDLKDVECLRHQGMDVVAARAMGLSEL